MPTPSPMCWACGLSGLSSCASRWWVGHCRRQSYDLNDDGKFNVEYADVLGIPFDFTARPVVVGPGKPRQTVQVRAMRPERDHLEITFPRVAGYREDPPKEDLVANFTDDSRLDLTPELVGPTQTRNEGIIGEGVDLNLVHTGDMRTSSLVFHLTNRLLQTKWRDPNEDIRYHLFGKLRSVVKEWLDNYLDCRGGTYPAQLMYQSLADMACNRITAAITSRYGERSVKALLDSYNPTGSTQERELHHLEFRSVGHRRPQGAKSTYVVLDSDWEAEFCRVVESHPSVKAYVKNHNLGLEVPVPVRLNASPVHPRLHPAGGRRSRGPVASRGGDQGIPGRGRQGEKEHHGGLLAAGRERSRRLRPLGLRRVHGRLRHRTRPAAGD